MKKSFIIASLAFWFMPSLQAWLGRGVIIALDTFTKNYRILFVKKNKIDETWTDFHREAEYQVGEIGDDIALDAIKTQLKEAYDIDKLKRVFWAYNKKTKDIFHIFVAKKFIPGKTLFNNMKDISDVKWSSSLTDFTKMEIDKDLAEFLKTATENKALQKYLNPSQAPKTSSSKKHHKKSSTKSGKQSGIEASLNSHKWPEPGTPNTIHFYHAKQPYYEFANTFDAGSVIIGNKEWASTEHYFQSQKFKDPRSAYENYLKNEGFGSLQKSVPGILKNHPSEDIYKFSAQQEGTPLSFEQKRWHGDESEKNLFLSKGKKHTAMLKALIAKFTQKENLKKILLNTGDALIIEDTKQALGKRKDSEWGAGEDYKGRNILGQMLMWLRDQIRKGYSPDDIIKNSKNFVRVIDPKDYLQYYLMFTQKKSEQPIIEKKKTEEKPAGKKKKKVDQTPLFKDFACALATIKN